VSPAFQLHLPELIVEPEQLLLVLNLQALDVVALLADFLLEPPDLSLPSALSILAPLFFDLQQIGELLGGEHE
jgi:hypothetical protein